ncbi:MAG: hypothetical protein Q9213_000660 [Squamulea squamosa]
MGYKRDQDYNADTFRRASTELTAATELPPPYTEEERSTSKVSPVLPPQPSATAILSSNSSRRKLLLIYVHGFTGNETSFQRFPTDVHDLTSKGLAEGYTVQSIVYPKYKSRKKIDFARDEFSSWLREYETDETDIILLGHSMGGLLAAEVALLPLNTHSATPLRHRILGTINLDVPFLGVHPRIVASGISSLFRKAPSQPNESYTLYPGSLVTQNLNVDLSGRTPPPTQAGNTSIPSRLTSSSSFVPTTSSLSPNLGDSSPEPPAVSDPKQSTLSRAVYFINKHSGDLTKATKSYFASHIEFGGCLVDFKGLLNRYSGIRGLEDNPGSRVRFVNYYTSSTGRPKKQKPPCSVEGTAQIKKLEDRGPLADPEIPEPNLSSSDTELQQVTPRPSTDKEEEDAIVPYLVANEESSDNELSDPSEDITTEVPDQMSINLTIPPMRDPPGIPCVTTSSPEVVDPDSSTIPSADSLPPLPDPPSKPPPLDTSIYPDKGALKIASRDHDRALKTYNRLLKDRDNAIKDRRKLLKKRAKAAAKEKQEEEHRALKGKGKVDVNNNSASTKTDNLQDATMSTSDLVPIPDMTAPPSAAPATAEFTSTTPAKVPKPPKQPKPLKNRTFCLLPHQPDPTWIRVIMRDVDEIDAHCGLFARDGEHYEGFMTAVVERICAWIKDNEQRGGM